MKNLSLLTWKEIQDIEKSNSIVFVTMAPIEQSFLYRIPFLHLGLMKRRSWKKVTI